MKKVLFSLIASSLLLFNLSSAKADPTYAVLDKEGKVINIIVCGSACAGGTFDGQTVVPQVAADPITGENRGGMLTHSGGSVNYDFSDRSFSFGDEVIVEPTINSVVEVDENGNTITSSAIITGSKQSSFKYEDTINNNIDNIFLQNEFTLKYKQNSIAKISVNNGTVEESLTLNNRKTVNEIQESIQNSGLELLSLKVQTLISLLGSWVK